VECHQTEYRFSSAQKALITQLLRENGIHADADSLLCFMVEAIEGREYAKLVFTRTLSDVLRLIGDMGTKYGVSKENLSYLDVKILLNLYSALDHRDLKEILMADIRVNRKLYDYTRAIKLPALIRTPSDVYSFPLEAESPNYITLGKVIAETAHETEINRDGVSGKVVFVRSADPGYDFLFTKQIAGLVTQFGGANSHMAIRCAELGIPAVIGAGEKNFTDWSKACTLEIDCAGKQVRVIA
jgi:phosphohistidine swiveling domain-containing protein